MIDILKIKLNDDDINNRRKQVSKLLLLKSQNIDSENIRRISASDLKLLFGIYDDIFFQKYLEKYYKGKVKFSLSKRMTKSAGMTLCPKNIASLKPEQIVIEIRIGVEFFFNYELTEGAKMVSGIKTSNSLEALQLVFEHELCHLLEFIHFNESNCNKQRFKAIANNLFLHTGSHHRLPTHREIAYQRFGIKIGDTVTFTFDGEKLTGILYNINKRATVMVKNNSGHLVDKEGNRYVKYYIPIKYLN